VEKMSHTDPNATAAAAAAAAQAQAAAAFEQFSVEAFTLLGVGICVTILRNLHPHQDCRHQGVSMG
jgi:hypothetical protein